MFIISMDLANLTHADVYKLVNFYHYRKHNSLYIYDRVVWIGYMYFTWQPKQLYYECELSEAVAMESLVIIKEDNVSTPGEHLRQV